MTTIAKDKVVSFQYQLYEGDELLEDSQGSQGMLYLHGHGTVFAKLEEALEGKSVGDKVSTTLRPDEAYGYRQQNSVMRIPAKHLLPNQVMRPGAVVMIQTPRGPQEAVLVKKGRFNVDVDTNHPLAGKTVRFEMEVETVRDATIEELAHGHAHGPGGHHH